MAVGMTFRWASYWIASMAILTTSTFSSTMSGNKLDTDLCGQGKLREYKYVAERMKWEDAEKHCNSLSIIHGSKKTSSTLAIIDNDSTRDAVAAVARTNIWIGLKENVTTKTWETVDGVVNTYNGWDPSQPNPYLSGTEEEDRAVMMLTDKKWHDYPSFWKFPFVCQKIHEVSMPDSCYNSSIDQQPWVMIQRSMGPFNRTGMFWRGKWQDFKEGFSSEKDNHYWFGLEKIHQLTSTGDWELLLFLKYYVATKSQLTEFTSYSSMNPKLAYVIHRDFKVADEKFDYTLHIGGRTKHMDVPSQFLEPSNGQPFATKDKPGKFRSCIPDFGAGWWFTENYSSPRLDGCFRCCMNCDLHEADRTREIYRELRYTQKDQAILTMMAMRRIDGV